MICLVIGCWSSTAHAWNGPGHMIVAAIAYRELNPQERQKATDLLKLHYNYPKWKAEVPDNDMTLDEGIALFMGASKWPDEIKFGNSSWNHKEWHYVDYPLTPPEFPIKPPHRRTTTLSSPSTSARRT